MTSPAPTGGPFMKAELSQKDKIQAPLFPQFEWTIAAYPRHITISQITGLPRIHTRPFTPWPIVHLTPILICDPTCHRTSTSTKACISRVSMVTPSIRRLPRLLTMPGSPHLNRTLSIDTRIRTTRHNNTNPRWRTPVPHNISKLSRSTSHNVSQRKSLTQHRLSVHSLVTCVLYHSIGNMT